MTTNRGISTATLTLHNAGRAAQLRRSEPAKNGYHCDHGRSHTSSPRPTPGRSVRHSCSSKSVPVGRSRAERAGDTFQAPYTTEDSIRETLPHRIQFAWWSGEAQLAHYQTKTKTTATTDPTTETTTTTPV